jgi:transposase
MKIKTLINFTQMGGENLGTYNRVDNETRERIKALRKEGLTIPEISKQFGMPTSTVRFIIVPRKQYTPFKTHNQQHADLIKMNQRKTWQIRDYWDCIKEAKQIKIDGQVYEVVQVTEHHLTYRKNGLRYCINRQELYTNTNLVEVV